MNTCTQKVAAASSFEPDFVFPLENVTIAQGRDGLYLNKSNKIVIFGVASDTKRGSTAEIHARYPAKLADKPNETV